MRKSRYRDVTAAIGIALLGAAVVQQVRPPRSERTWRGTLAGVVPYDLLLPRVAGVG